MQVGWKYKVNTCTEVPLNSSEYCFCTCTLFRDSHKLKRSRMEEQQQMYNLGWPYVILCRSNAVHKELQKTISWGKIKVTQAICISFNCSKAALTAFVTKFCFLFGLAITRSLITTWGRLAIHKLKFKFTWYLSCVSA